MQILGFSFLGPFSAKLLLLPGLLRWFKDWVTLDLRLLVCKWIPSLCRRWNSRRSGRKYRRVSPWRARINLRRIKRSFEEPLKSVVSIKLSSGGHYVLAMDLTEFDETFPPWKKKIRWRESSPYLANPGTRSRMLLDTVPADAGLWIFHFCETPRPGVPLAPDCHSDGRRPFIVCEQCEPRSNLIATSLIHFAARSCRSPSTVSYAVKFRQFLSIEIHTNTARRLPPMEDGGESWTSWKTARALSATPHYSLNNSFP